MNLTERLEAFKGAYRKWPASWPWVATESWLTTEQDRDVLYGIWVIGNDYRNKSALYGAYPAGYLERVLALFPDAGDELPPTVLHVFSGSLPPGAYDRLDLIDRCGVVDPWFHWGNVYDAATIFEGRERFGLVLADPPYSEADAVQYGTPMVDRRRVLASLAEVTKPGGHLVWLDTMWPMHSKTQWVTVGRILLQRSTNHRVRVVSIFERVGEAQLGTRTNGTTASASLLEMLDGFSSAQMITPDHVTELLS